MVLEEQAVGSLRHLRCVQVPPGTPWSAGVQLAHVLMMQALAYLTYRIVLACLGSGPDVKPYLWHRMCPCPLVQAEGSACHAGSEDRAKACQAS